MGMRFLVYYMEDLVLALHQSVGVASRLDVPQLDVPGKWPEKRNAGPDKNGDPVIVRLWINPAWRNCWIVMPPSMYRWFAPRSDSLLTSSAGEPDVISTVLARCSGTPALRLERTTTGLSPYGHLLITSSDVRNLSGGHHELLT